MLLTIFRMQLGSVSFESSAMVFEPAPKEVAMSLIATEGSRFSRRSPRAWPSQSRNGVEQSLGEPREHSPGQVYVGRAEFSMRTEGGFMESQ